MTISGGKDYEHSQLVHMPELLFLTLVLKLFYSSIIIKAYNFFFTQLGTSKKKVVGSLSQEEKQR